MYRPAGSSRKPAEKPVVKFGLAGWNCGRPTGNRHEANPLGALTDAAGVGEEVAVGVAATVALAAGAARPPPQPARTSPTETHARRLNTLAAGKRRIP